MTQQATELIAKQMAAGASIGRIWGTLIYNVKDTAYGAKGDGATDDTVAIQTAINAAQTAGGGVVVFPPGTYIINAAITANSNVILEGSGISSIIRCNTTIDKMISIQGIIRDLRINGNLKATKGISLDGNYATVKNCYIEYCTNGIYNNAFDGHNLLYNITANNTYAIYSADRFINVVIDGHQSRAADGHGVYCTYTTQQPQGIRITNSLFFGNTTAAIKFAKDAYEIEISNNMIDGSYGICIDIAGSPTNVSQCYKISNNFIAPANSVSGGVGIWIRPGARDIFIYGNTITLASYWGVLIEAAAPTKCSSITLLKNKFNGNNRQTGSGDIFADSVTDLVLAFNDLLTTTGTSFTTAASVSAGNTLALGNKFVTSPNPSGGVNTFRDNQGYVTRAEGLALMAAAATTVTVTHGMNVTPNKVYLTAQGNLGAVWVTGITATQFVINCAAAPAGGTQVAWDARLN